jgi:hypothetical protein
VETLVSSRFFDGLKLAVTVGEPGVGDTLQAPEDETVRAVVGLFRTLYNDHEPTSYAAILKLVSPHAHERQSPPNSHLLADRFDYADPHVPAVGGASQPTPQTKTCAMRSR